MTDRSSIIVRVLARIRALAELIVRNIPDELFGTRVRHFIYRGWFAGADGFFAISSGVFITGFDVIRIGARGNIARGVMLYAHDSNGIRLGDDCSIGPGTIVSSADGGEVTIGDGGLIGPKVVIISANHVYADPNQLIRRQGFSAKPIEIGRDVWIGANAVILSGVRIGDGSIIGAGSVVNQDVPPQQIWAGVPARFVKNRSGENDMAASGDGHQLPDTERVEPAARLR